MGTLTLLSLILNALLLIMVFSLWLRTPAKSPSGSTMMRHKARTIEFRKKVVESLEPFEQMEYDRLFLQEHNQISGVSDRLDELENLAQTRLMGK